MEKLSNYKSKFIKIIIVLCLFFLSYYLIKTVENKRVSLVLGLIFILAIVYIAFIFRERLKEFKNSYGLISVRLFRESIQKINSFFIGFYGLIFILSIDVDFALENLSISGLDFGKSALLISYLDFIIGFIFIICARLSFDRQKRFIYILYPLLFLTGGYLIINSEKFLTLTPLIIIGVLTHISSPSLVKESFIYSIEEFIIDLVFALIWLVVYLKNTTVASPISRLSLGFRFMFFALIILSMLVVLGLILKFMKKDEPMTKPLDIEEFANFLQANNLTHSTSAGLGFLRDKYVYYYKNKDGEKVLAFLYQLVNDKIVVMGEPFGDPAYMEEGLNSFIEKTYKLSLKPIFYEVGEKFTLNLHDYGFDFMKFGENAFIDLEKFSLAGRKKSSLRNILNRFKKDGYEFKLLDPPHSEKLLDRLDEISKSWLGDRFEKGFSLGFFDRDYLNKSRIGLVYDSKGHISAFVNIMPNHDKDIMTIDLMRYDSDMNVNSMMDYLFLNLFITGQNEGYKYFNLGMAPLSNVGTYKSAYLSERIASLIYSHAGRIYPFRGLRNYKSKYATTWKPRYVSFAKGNFILSSMAAILAADKGKIGGG